MANIRISEKDLKREFGRKIASVAYDESYVEVTGESNEEGIFSVGGELSSPPDQFIKCFLGCYLNMQEEVDVTVRFYEACDKNRLNIRKIPIRRKDRPNAIPLDYIVTFSHPQSSQPIKEQDKAIFQALEQRLSALKKWVKFYSITSNFQDDSNTGNKITKYHQTSINLL